MADYGASVIRIDRAQPSAHSPTPPPPTADNLVRHKSSIAVDFKSGDGIAFVKSLLKHVDVIIDPFRPGVLERLGLSPEEVMLKINPRLIVARMTGFRRDGKYKDMAGHDINYIAVSGALSMLGRKGEAPNPPGNILGDFAGGGAVCFMGILLALMAREKRGTGQVVEANMVDGAAYLATFPRLALKTPMWNEERGTNTLDGGAPFYGTYETKDGKWMSVGALEPQFFEELLKGLALKASDLPGDRLDKKTWAALKALFTFRFLTKTRAEWEDIFDGTDACVAPVVTNQELEKDQFDLRPIVTLKESPGFAIAKGPTNRSSAVGQGPGVEGGSFWTERLSPSVGGEDVLKEWLGWQKGDQYDVRGGGLVLNDTKSKL